MRRRAEIQGQAAIVVRRVFAVSVARAFFALPLFAQAAWGGQISCPLPGQEPMVVARLFFGRAIPGRAPVSDGEWDKFVAEVIAPDFPDGFTVQDGEGAWRDPVSHRVVREHTKILTVAFPRSAGPRAMGVGQRLEVVTRAYRRQFHQTSVGMLTEKACGAF